MLTDIRFLPRAWDLISDREAGTEPDTPRYDYPLNQKYQVWSYNVESLYEEAVSRQWSATRDIPWDKLEPLSNDQERALCQFVGFLHTVEFIPGDTLPFYMAGGSLFRRGAVVHVLAVRR